MNQPSSRLPLLSEHLQLVQYIIEMTGDSETTALTAATKGNDAIQAVLTSVKKQRTTQAIAKGGSRHCSAPIIRPARRLDRFLSGLRVFVGSLQLGMSAADDRVIVGVFRIRVCELCDSKVLSVPSCLIRVPLRIENINLSRI
jgi:hypothetical protein